MVDAVLQLAALKFVLRGPLVHSGDVRAMEPAKPRAAIPRQSGHTTVIEWGRLGRVYIRATAMRRVPPECVRINHINAGDAMRLYGRVFGKLDYPHSVKVVKQLQE